MASGHGSGTGSGYASNGDDSERERAQAPGLSFTPRRAMTSFDNLVALANHQERLKEARKMVWRDRGEPVTELNSVRECLKHATTGGIRAGTLAFSIRACINVVLELVRMRKVPPKKQLVFLLKAIFGEDTWRFAAMLATFVSTYKFLLNSLPILIPAINPKTHPDVFDDDDEERPEPHSGTVVVPLNAHEKSYGYRRMARLSLSTKAQMALVRKRTRRWHAALAGALAGGLGVMWEKRGRRVTIAQQLFVRGLQGSYNYWATKYNMHVPHGDVLVFTIACAQIMYAWTMRPDTLPRSYSAWITQAGRLPQEGVDLNWHLVRKGTPDPKALATLMARTDLTHHNRTMLETWAKTGEFPNYGPCEALHPWRTFCMDIPVERFFMVAIRMLPIYGALHLIPAILFKRKAFMQDPLSVLVRAGWGTARSSAFLGVFVVLYQSMNCFQHQLYPSLVSANPALEPLLRPFLTANTSFIFPGVMAGLSLFVEAKRRRGELAMYVLPKALESAWVIWTGKVGLKRYNRTEGLLCAAGMAMVMSTYQNSPGQLSGLVRRILYQFIGPN